MMGQGIKRGGKYEKILKNSGHKLEIVQRLIYIIQKLRKECWLQNKLSGGALKRTWSEKFAKFSGNI